MKTVWSAQGEAAQFIGRAEAKMVLYAAWQIILSFLFQGLYRFYLQEYLLFLNDVEQLIVDSLRDYATMNDDHLLVKDGSCSLEDT